VAIVHAGDIVSYTFDQKLKNNNLPIFYGGKLMNWSHALHQHVFGVHAHGNVNDIPIQVIACILGKVT
jgi:hypothetical protein